MACTHSRQLFLKGEWICKDCGPFTARAKRPLTDYERLKLSWYRDEKRWEDNIRSRQIVTDTHGKKHVVVPGLGEIPQQPREYWPKPKTN